MYINFTSTIYVYTHIAKFNVVNTSFLEEGTKTI